MTCYTTTSEREPPCTTHPARRADMAFFQMDDGFDSEPRVLQAATAAFGLYSRCGIWAARNGTDGFVSEHIAALYGTREWIERLVDSGLWVRVDGGFTMPDYLEIHGNWPAEKIRAHRAAAAERQARARARKADADHDAMSRRESRVTHTGSHAVSHSAPSPSHPHPIDDSLRSSSTSAGGETDIKAKPKPKRPAPPDGFGVFWDAYPRKVAKAAAEKAYTRALADGADPALILAGAEFYALERKLQDPKYTKHPATWLNARCWEDEPDPEYRPPVIGAPSEAATAQPRPWAEVRAEQRGHTSAFQPPPDDEFGDWFAMDRDEPR